MFLFVSLCYDDLCMARDELDYLLVDTPPGTSDEHLSITSYLNETGVDGAVIVTTPQALAFQSHLCIKSR